jgi:hypothetical protein
VGIGTTTPTFRLHVADNTPSYDGYFINAGDNVDRRGLAIACGKYTPTANGHCIWISLFDGNGTALSNVQYQTTTPFAAFVAESDERVKTNIRDTQVNGLEVINGLRLREFDYLDGQKPHQRIGYIAQEAQRIYPEMVSYKEDEDRYYVGDSVLVSVLVKSVQELSAQVKELKAEVDMLKKARK